MGVSDREGADASGRPLDAWPREVSWWFILMATVAVFALITAFSVSVHFRPGFYRAVFVQSRHLITPALIGGGLLFVAVFAGLVVFGKLAPREFGWQRSKVGTGLGMAGLIWVTMQLVQLIVTLASGGTPRLSPSWSTAGWATAVGLLLGQALGIAPSEETFFRGFLLPQMRLKFSRLKARTAVAVAIVLSQLIFALYHIPNLVLGISGKVGTTASEVVNQLVWDFVIGVVFAGLYLRTGNLFLVIGIHALQNAGTTVVTPIIDPSRLMFILAVIVLLVSFVPPIARRLRGIDARPSPGRASVLKSAS